MSPGIAKTTQRRPCPSQRFQGGGGGGGVFKIQGDLGFVSPTCNTLNPKTLLEAPLNPKP